MGNNRNIWWIILITSSADSLLLEKDGALILFRRLNIRVQGYSS